MRPHQSYITQRTKYKVVVTYLRRAFGCNMLQRAAERTLRAGLAVVVYGISQLSWPKHMHSRRKHDTSEKFKWREGGSTPHVGTG